MRYLDAAALRVALPMPDAIEAMRTAFADDSESTVRTRLGVSLFMPGRVGANTGVKVVSTVPGDPAGVVVVFGPDGHPLGLVDGPTLTSIRTAAAPGLLTDLLAPADASVLTMFGGGAMAADQVAAIRHVRPIERVLVWSRSEATAAACAERVGGEVELDPDAAARVADIVSSATPSHTPLFSADSVRPGTHINAVGAYTPEMIEIPFEITRAAFVVVDDRVAAAEEAGDLLQAAKSPDADVGDLLTGRATRGDQPFTLFKSVGIAEQDVAAAVIALGNAERDGLGVELG